MNKAEKIAAIAAITQLFKFYGSPSAWCPPIAIAVGIILEYGEQPNAKGALDGLLLGAIVAGGYGMAKGVGQTILNRPNTDDYSDLEADDDRGV